MILKSAVPRLTARWMAALGLIAAVGLPTFVGCASKKPESAGELLSLAAEARSKALATVKSGKGSVVDRIRWRGDGSDKLDVVPGQLAFSGDKWRVISHYKPNSFRKTSTTTEIISDGTALRIVTTHDKQAPSSHTWTRPDHRPMHFYRSYWDMVSKAYPDLREVLHDHKNPPRILGREKIDGSECIVLESVRTFTLKNGRRSTETKRLWIDPARSYAIPKLQVWNQGGYFKQKSLLSQSRARLKRYDGMWLPASYTHDAYRADPKTGKHYLLSSQLITYAPDFAINVPVTDKDLHLPIPSEREPVAGSSESERLKRAETLAGLTAVTGPGAVVTLPVQPLWSGKSPRFPSTKAPISWKLDTGLSRSETPRRSVGGEVGPPEKHTVGVDKHAHRG